MLLLVFKSDIYIKKCYFNMINLCMKKYGYIFDGLTLKQNDNYQKNKGEYETIPLFKHIENSILDLYKDNNDGYLYNVREIIEDRIYNYYIINRRIR